MACEVDKLYWDSLEFERVFLGFLGEYIYHVLCFVFCG